MVSVMTGLRFESNTDVTDYNDVISFEVHQWVCSVHQCVWMEE